MAQRTWLDHILRGTIFGLLATFIVLGSAYGVLKHQKMIRDLNTELALYKGMTDEAVKMITEEKPLVARDPKTGDIYVKSFGRVHQYAQVCRPEMGL